MTQNDAIITIEEYNREHNITVLPSPALLSAISSFHSPAHSSVLPPPPVAVLPHEVPPPAPASSQPAEIVPGNDRKFIYEFNMKIILEARSTIIQRKQNNLQNKSIN